VNDVFKENSYRNMVLHAMGVGDAHSNDMVSSPMVAEELPNPEADKFYKLLKAAEESLWDGCTKQSKLSACVQLLNMKSTLNLTQTAFNKFTEFTKSCMPDNENLVSNFYDAKKFMRPLGLGYDKYDVCPNYFMLYYGVDAMKTCCDFCGSLRYKPRNLTSKGSNKSEKQLRYFPLTPRLQRLFMSPHHAKDMTWHHFHRSDDGVMVHPSDGEAWKKFNEDHQDFASDPRNIRLGLCTDGFSPFDMSSNVYSCWPVIVTVYNLPPWKCMTRPFMFLSMIIPGPKNPGKKLDVFLRPLIDELKKLWLDGVNTYDIYRKENFQLRAALMWTIIDFPTYGMLSGWSTHGKLSCPYCMEHSKAFRLKHGRKITFFYCH